MSKVKAKPYSRLDDLKDVVPDIEVSFIKIQTL
jgi:hypothetical protein